MLGCFVATYDNPAQAGPVAHGCHHLSVRCYCREGDHIVCPADAPHRALSSALKASQRLHGSSNRTIV